MKRNGHVFSPPLAPAVTGAVHVLGYGNLDKVSLKFPRPFWNGNEFSVGPISKPTFPIESLFLNPEYATDANPAKWRKEITSFLGLPELFSQPVIMFFVYGQ